MFQYTPLNYAVVIHGILMTPLPDSPPTYTPSLSSPTLPFPTKVQIEIKRPMAFDGIGVEME